MVQQIELIIHTNIQPLPAYFFLLKVKVMVNEKKILVNVINNVINNYWISPIFNVKLPMSMEMT